MWVASLCPFLGLTVGAFFFLELSFLLLCLCDSILASVLCLSLCLSLSTGSQPLALSAELLFLQTLFLSRWDPGALCSEVSSFLGRAASWAGVTPTPGGAATGVISTSECDLTAEGPHGPQASEPVGSSLLTQLCLRDTGASSGQSR